MRSDFIFIYFVKGLYFSGSGAHWFSHLQGCQHLQIKIREIPEGEMAEGNFCVLTNKH